MRETGELVVVALKLAEMEGRRLRSVICRAIGA
jgi:hypothetical protein